MAAVVRQVRVGKHRKTPARPAHRHGV
jgi:hypothetical protein